MNEVHCILFTINFRNKYICFCLGDSGENLIEWLRFLLCRDFKFPHIKVIFPTAPLQPFTIFNGVVLRKRFFFYII